MQISIDGVELLTLSETQKKVIQSVISAEIFEEEIRRMISWLLISQRYQIAFNALKKDWEKKLSQRYDSVPTDPDQLAQLIFEQPDYKDRATIINEEKASKAARDQALLAAHAARIAPQANQNISLDASKK